LRGAWPWRLFATVVDDRGPDQHLGVQAQEK
jgi:hypothetical protein